MKLLAEIFDAICLPRENVGLIFPILRKLNRLVSEKLQSIAEAVKAESWKWVELQPTLDYQSLSQYKRIHAPVLPLSAEAEAENLAALVETLTQHRPPQSLELARQPRTALAALAHVLVLNQFGLDWASIV